MNRLTDAVLQQLADSVDDENTVAITLAGSYARDEATPYSDVDIVRYVKVLPESDDCYTLRYEGDLLVSISAAKIEDKRAELQSPGGAIWAVPGLRQAKILKDTDGAFAQLQAEAFAFEWNNAMQQKADAYASYHFMGYAEEAHKILSGLYRDDASVMMYGTVGMILGLTRIIAVQRGILLPTENAYFQAIQQAMPEHHTLVHALNIATGLGMSSDGALPRMRAIAALQAYVETAALLSPCIQSAHRPTIDRAIAIIHEAGVLQAFN